MQLKGTIYFAVNKYDLIWLNALHCTVVFFIKSTIIIYFRKESILVKY